MAGDQAFKDWLKQRRKSLDLTQAELAHRVGCSLYTVQRIEEGTNRPSRQLAELLAAGLEIPPEDRTAFVRLARSTNGRVEIPPLPRAAPTLAAVAGTPARPTNPYKGLRAFQEDDAPDFFGREALIQRVCERLVEGTELARFLAVVGPSGAGKSSLVRAGLLPLLRRQGLGDGRSPIIVDIIPGAHPLEELEAALLRVAVNAPPNLIEQLRADERGLARVVRRVLPADERSYLLLLIDQFEELFTLVPDEQVRAGFINSLFSAVADERSRLRVVVTLRADFYDRPLLYLPSSELFEQRSQVVGPLASDEMYRAIVEPAERHGLELESGLAAAIMQDVAEQPGMLPLLEYTLTELFERREGRLLTLAAYKASGGVFGSLARRADGLYAGLTLPQQPEARQLFLRLVTLGEGSEDTRRRVPLAEVLSAARDEQALRWVLDLYGRYRMLTFDRERLTGGPTVEVAHEALLRGWGRLRGWLGESRERLQVERRLLSSAAEWQAAGRDPSFLATGARLAQFAALAEDQHSPRAVALDEGEQRFLAASLAEQERQAEAERARQERELELSRQTAAAAERAARAQRTAASRLRVLVVALALFGAIAGSLAVWALQRSQAAQQGEEQARTNLARADALRLVGAADNLRITRGPAELFALLTVRAVERQYAAEAEADLATASDLDYPLRVFSGHNGALLSVAFSPDGKHLLAGTGLWASKGNNSGPGDFSARLWDIASGEVVRVFTGHINVVNGVAFSPDGKSMATASDDGSARIWDVASARTLRTLKQPARVNGVSFSPDGTYLLTTGLDSTAHLWDTSTGEPVGRFGDSQNSVNGAVFSPDGKFVATWGTDNMALLWDSSTWQILRRFRGQGLLTALAFSPDGHYLVTGSDDAVARLWDVASGDQVRLFAGHTRWIGSVAFSPDGKYLLTGALDKTARLWDVASGEAVHVFSDYAGPSVGVAFAPDGQTFATISGDVAQLWRVQRPLGERSFGRHTGAVLQASFSPDGKRVVSAGADWFTRVWDTASGQNLRGMITGTAQVRGAVFSPDGKSVLSSSADGSARMWDAASGTLLFTLSGHSAAVNRGAFSPDGRYIATASDDGTARVWDAATGRTLAILGAQGGEHVNAVAFSANGQQVATGADDGTARIWDALTGKQLLVLRGHAGPLYGVTFAPDGKTVLTGGADATARIWDALTGKQLLVLRGHAGPLYDVAISPDGKFLLTGGDDHTARLWDASSGAELRRFSGHTAPVRSVAFSPDGRFVLTASDDKTARLADADYRDTIDYLCMLLTRDLTTEERAEFAIGDQQPTCPAQSAR